jgi:hypothetical protein
VTKPLLTLSQDKHSHPGSLLKLEKFMVCLAPENPYQSRIRLPDAMLRARHQSIVETLWDKHDRTYPNFTSYIGWGCP